MPRYLTPPPPSSPHCIPSQDEWWGCKCADTTDPTPEVACCLGGRAWVCKWAQRSVLRTHAESCTESRERKKELCKSEGRKRLYVYLKQTSRKAWHETWRKQMSDVLRESSQLVKGAFFQLYLQRRWDQRGWGTWLREHRWAHTSANPRILPCPYCVDIIEKLLNKK